jgi:Kef-type K+ transport system membrane component KefB
VTDFPLTSLLVVIAVAFAAPFLLALVPRVRLPEPVLEILAGIVLGPSLLNVVQFDTPVAVLSFLGLSFLLFLAGMEISFDKLRGRPLELAAASFALSIGLGLAVGLGFHAMGLVRVPLYIAVALLATSLGLVVPILADSGEAGSPFGQLVIAAASLADFGAVVLLSLFFSSQAGDVTTRLLLLGALAITGVVVAVTMIRAERLTIVSRVFARTHGTTAELRVRGAVLLLVAFAALARSFGVELILGAFLAGAVLSLADRDGLMRHPEFELKLRAVGYGLLIPVFFVGTGIQFDLNSLLASADGLLRIPLFVAGLLVVRGLPAVLYAGTVGPRRSLAAGLLQATSLPFLVTAATIGARLGIISQAASAGLVAAGLVSVIVFPLLALTLLRSSTSPAPAPG